jgi:hypothetical protein
VLVTALTTIAALATSTNTDLPAVAMFASFGALSFAMSLCVIFTFFLSLLVLDERRLHAGRLSFAPCLSFRAGALGVEERGASGAAAGSSPAAMAPAGEAAMAAAPDARATRAAHDASLGPVQRFLRDRYAPALLSPAGSVVVVLAFAGLAILSAVAIPRIQIGLPQADVLPDDSYVRNALRAEALFGGKISAAQVVVAGGDYDDDETRARYVRARANVARLDFVKLTPPDWLGAYEICLASHRLRDAPFTSELGACLDDERYARFQDDVACEGKCARPAAVRFGAVYSEEHNTYTYNVSGLVEASPVAVRSIDSGLPQPSPTHCGAHKNIFGNNCSWPAARVAEPRPWPRRAHREQMVPASAA